MHEPVAIDHSQVRKLAPLLKNSPSVQPFNFAEDSPELFPSENDPCAPDFFFFATLHQFGFWHANRERYLEPMVGTINGKRFKGSDFFWRATLRAQSDQKRFLTAEFQAKLKPKDFAHFYRDDSGKCPLPMLKEHWHLAVQCGQDLLKRKCDPKKILEKSNKAFDSLSEFLKIAGQITGYKEDPLRKKLMLLAVILAERPEHFLKVRKHSDWQPIVDYHVQRTALRTGLVEIRDAKLKEKIMARKIVSAKEEQKIRVQIFKAMQELEKLSGKSAAALDWLFFSARKKCPEMTEPDCPNCVMESVCAKRKELFQPVFRTTHY